MHVVFIGTYGLWTPHTETELELAERHLVAGDRVSWVICDAAFESCDTNAEHNPIRCNECKWRVQAGINALSGPVEVTPLSKLLTSEDRARINALPRSFQSMEEVREVMVDGLDAGWGALSTAVWLARDVEIDLTTDLVPRLVRAGATSYLATKRLLARETFDRVYAFNGRMAPMRGILRATRELDVECMIHERGRDLEHYALFENALPHDIDATVIRSDNVWRDSELSDEEKRRVGSAWFEGRPKGQMGSWISFVEGQDESQLPEDWDSSRRNVALFTTSEYEYMSIGKDWDSPLYKSPHDATMRIAEALSARGKVHLTIRVHPNPDGAKSSSVKATVALNIPGVTIIPPTSDVSTYALMQAADAVVTSGSTAGFEATFWKRPSVLAGRGLYSGMGIAHEPKTADELLDMLEDPTLQVADREAAIRYGFYHATRGEPYRYFEPDGLFSGKFKGEYVQPSRFQKKILRLRWKMTARRQ